MISYLVENHVKDGTTLKLTPGSASRFGTPPYKVTVIKRSAVKGKAIVHSNSLAVYSVSAVSGDTLTISADGFDQSFAIGDYVVPGVQTTDITDINLLQGQLVYTSDRFDNPDFIKTLAYSKLTNVNTNQVGLNSLAINEETIAVGIDSFASGYESIASDNYCHTEGYQTFAGVPVFDCDISGNSVTVNEDVTSWFHNSGSIAIFNQSSSLLTTVTSSPAYDGSVTTFTIADSPSFSSTRICPTDLGNHGCHTEGVLTQAIGHASHAEGQSTRAFANQAHAEGAFTHASGDQAHAEGLSTIASGLQSHAEGFNTNASGPQSHVEGDGTLASAYASHAGGVYSVSSLISQWSRSSGCFNVSGDAQCSNIVAYSNGSTDLLIGANNDPIVIPNGHAYAFIATISAYDGTNGAMYVRQGMIRNVGGTYSLIGSIQTIGTDITHSGWSIAIAANNGLKITPTGTAHWVARIDWVEIG